MRKNHGVKMNVQTIDIALISEHPVLRMIPPTQPIYADSINKSRKSVGSIVPIIVAPEGNGFLLIDGRTRLASARQLGEKSIEAIVRDTDEDALTIAVDSALRRRQLTLTGAGLVLIEAHPELMDRAGESAADPEGGTLRQMAEAYNVPVDYFSALIAAKKACRPKSQDWSFCKHLVFEREISARNLLKALRGWQASHSVKEKADESDADVRRRAPVQPVAVILRSIRSLVNQFREWDKLDADDRAVVRDAWLELCEVVPKNIDKK